MEQNYKWRVTCRAEDGKHFDLLCNEPTKARAEKAIIATRLYWETWVVERVERNNPCQKKPS